MTRQPRALIVGVLVALTFAARDSAEVPIAQATAANVGVIRGRITTSDGAPLRRARIALTSLARQANALPIVTFSNSQGLYEVRDVAAGSYRVSVSRSGYITAEYGQRRALENGQPVDVRAGQAVDRIDVALPRGGVLAGRITDQFGEPFPGIRVESRQLRFIDGRRVFFPTGTANTDDLGEFRISGLQPGTYYLMASTREMWVGDRREVFGFGSTYYPGAAIAQAQSLLLTAGQERTNLDFRLTISRTARIAGIVQSATGAPIEAQTVGMFLEYRGAGVIAAGGLTATTGRDGSFSFDNVPPGEYVLQSRSTGAALTGTDEAAALHLDVTGSDMEGLLLRRQRGSTVAGSIVTDEGGAPPFAPATLRASPVAVDPDKTLNTSIYLPLREVKPDWTFAIPNIAGPYVFRFDGLPAGWMVKSVRHGVRDITDTPIDVPTGINDVTGLEVVLTRRVAQVSGDVVDAAGKSYSDVTVIVFAEDPDRWGLGTRFVRVARPSPDGRFTVTGLPGAAYLVVAQTSAMDGQWEDPTFLASIQREAQRVELGEGGSREIRLRVP